jgi:integrase
MEGHLEVNLYDRIFFKPLPLTDVRPSIDPYTPEERETILEAFRVRRPHYYPFVFFQFWEGARPTRRRHSDSKTSTLGIQSRIFTEAGQGKEGGTKTVSSNRTIHLHEEVIELLRRQNPAAVNVDREDYFFTTPAGTPIDESNFYKREWLRTLKALKIRHRPFYNTRHSYVSFLYSIGGVPVFYLKANGRQHKDP